MSIYFIALAVEKEVSTLTLSTSAAIDLCAELGPGSVSSTVAVQRGLVSVTTLRAVPGAPDDSPTGD